jgi:hypothetical protein
MNFKDLITLSKMIKKVEFSKSQKDKKDHFCKTCVLNKAHKIHSKISIVHRAKLFDERLHSDFFEDDIFSVVEKFKYKIIVIDDYTRMKFLIILKSKD